MDSLAMVLFLNIEAMYNYIAMIRNIPFCGLFSGISLLTSNEPGAPTYTASGAVSQSIDFLVALGGLIPELTGKNIKAQRALGDLRNAMSRLEKQANGDHNKKIEDYIDLVYGWVEEDQVCFFEEVMDDLWEEAMAEENALSTVDIDVTDRHSDRRCAVQQHELQYSARWWNRKVSTSRVRKEGKVDFKKIHQEKAKLDQDALVEMIGF